MEKNEINHEKKKKLWKINHEDNFSFIFSSFFSLSVMSFPFSLHSCLFFIPLHVSFPLLSCLISFSLSLMSCLFPFFPFSHVNSFLLFSHVFSFSLSLFRVFYFLSLMSHLLSFLSYTSYEHLLFLFLLSLTFFSLMSIPFSFYLMSSLYSQSNLS